MALLTCQNLIFAVLWIFALFLARLNGLLFPTEVVCL